MPQKVFVPAYSIELEQDGITRAIIFRQVKLLPEVSMSLKHTYEIRWNGRPVRTKLNLPVDDEDLRKPNAISDLGRKLQMMVQREEALEAAKLAAWNSGQPRLARKKRKPKAIPKGLRMLPGIEIKERAIAQNALVAGDI